MRKYAFWAAERYGNLSRVKAHAIEEAIRQRYTVSDELAILRQRDTNPEEFAEYNAFVEQVKANISAEIERQREWNKNRDVKSDKQIETE